MANNSPKSPHSVASAIDEIAHRMAHKYANEDHWALSEDDIYSELMLIVLRVSEKYDKLPEPNYISMCVTSMRNRVYDMYRMYYMRARKCENNAHSLSLDEDDPAFLEIGSMDVDTELEEQEMYDQVSLVLEGVDMETFQLLMGQNPAAGTIMKLVSFRDGMNHVPFQYVVSRSLHISMEQAEQSLQNVKGVLRERRI